MNQFKTYEPLAASKVAPMALDADWEQERQRKEEQEQAVVRKWRAWLYSWRAEQHVGIKVQALMISSAVIFLWAVVLALLVG
jgi:hypothetical protein